MLLHGAATIRTACSALFLFAASAVPACAQVGAPVSEPSDLALFALAVVGVIVGRRGGRKR